MANYTVKKGDGWYKISKNTGIPVQELLKMNNATLDTIIHPGQILNVSFKDNKPKIVEKQQSQNEIQPLTSNYIPWQPTIAEGQSCGVDGCAKYANDTLREHKDKKGRKLYSYNDIGGHAWTRLSAGENTKMVYSGYEGTEYDKNNFSEQASDQRNFQAANRLLKEFDSKTLDKNKTYMVNMFYRGSGARRQAWEEALNGTTGTHTGNLYWNPQTNRWHVSHNIHGTIHDDDFIKIQGSKGRYGVTAIAEAPSIDYTETDRREDYRQRKPIRGWIRDKLGVWEKGGRLIPKAEDGIVLPEITVTAINPNDKNLGEDGKNFIRGLNNNRNHFMQKYGITDQEYADAAALAVNLAQRESGLGSGLSYNVRRFVPDSLLHIGKSIVRREPKVGAAKNLLRFALNPIEGTMTALSKYTDGQTGELSRGLTQIKYQQDIKNPELKELYDSERITEENLTTDPEAMAKATITRLQFNKKSLKPKYHYTDKTEIPSDVVQAIYWNRGKLTDYLNPNITDLNAGGATGYARRFVNQKVIS